MEILLASHNDHKAEEIRKLLPEKFLLSTLNDIQYFDEIVENGSTFKENAWIKSKTGFEISELPTFSDDSGLCIQALNNAPGIYSARYAGTGNSKDNIEKVLSELEGKTDRNAYFICVICFYDGKETQFFEGRIDGKIIEQEKGNDGFGYDPIFIPNGYDKTFAELPQEEKNKISHRAKALKQFIDFLNTY